jgi:hypothetical protein
MWNEADIICSEALSWHFAGGPGENLKNFSKDSMFKGRDLNLASASRSTAWLLECLRRVLIAQSV